MNMALLNCCIVCFRIGSCTRPNLLENEEEEEKLKVYKRFFKLLDRHLSSTGDKESPPSETCRTEEDLLLGKKLFFNYINNASEVQACEECLTLMSSFCEIYHKIKHLELLLSEKTWSLMNIMFCAMKVPARINSFKDVINHENAANISGDYIRTDGGELANSLLQYKKQLIARCSRKLSSSYPKLILERATQIKQNQVELQSSEEIDKSVYNISDCFSSELPLANGNDEDLHNFGIQFSPAVSIHDDESLPEIETLADITYAGNLPQMSINLEGVEQQITNEHNSGLECDGLIKTETKSVFRSRSLRVIHRCQTCKRTFSSEEKLTNHKNSSDCSHLEFEADSDFEMDSAKKPKIENDDEPNDCAFSNPDEETESSCCEDGGNAAVDAGRPRAKLIPKLRRKRNEGKLCCPICKQKFWITLQVYTHLNESHPEAFLTTPEKTEEVDKYACPLFYCPVTFDNIRSLRLHCVLRHKEEINFRRSVGGKNYLASDLKDPLRCPLKNCEAYCVNKAVLVIHMEFKHLFEWYPKNLSFLSKQFFKARLEELTVTQQSSADPEMKPFEDLEVEQSNSFQPRSRIVRSFRTVCPECTELFEDFNQMILHYKSQHASAQGNAGKIVPVEILNFLRKHGDYVKNFLTSDENKFEVFAKIEIIPNVFICPVKNCLQLFLYEEDLQAHSKLHGDFKCKFCDTTKDYAVDLIEHEIKKHTDNSGVYKSDESHRVLNCPRCDAVFKMREKYVSHHLSEHLGIQVYMEEGCPICRDPLAYSKRYSTRRLEIHLRKIHNILPEIGSFKELKRCRAEGCVASFLSVRHLRYHCKRVHDIEIMEKEERRYKKSKWTAVKARLTSKRRLWEKARGKLCCPVCSKKGFWCTEQVDAHVTQEHPEAFNYHFEEQKPNSYDCPLFYCARSFNNIRSGLLHIITLHKSEFKLRKKYGSQHYFTSDLENPCKCPFPNCESSCLNKAVLRIHMKNNHSEEWTPGNLTLLSKKFFKDRCLINEEGSKASEKLDKPVPDANLADSEGFSEQKLEVEEDLENNESSAENKGLNNKKCKSLVTVCPECFQFFEHFYEMISHLNSVHSSNSESGALTVEIINFPGRRGGKFVKDFVMSEKSKFEVFARLEIPPTIFTCTVDSCGQLFFNEDDLTLHLKLHGEFKCQFCEVLESNALDLAEHELKEHTENGGVRSDDAYLSTFSCPRCEDTFRWKQSYLRHHITDHLGIERMLEQCCPICRDPYRYLDRCAQLPGRNKQLEEHIKEEHDLNAVSETKKLQKCNAEGCPAYYLTRKQFLAHMQMVHCKEKNHSKRRRMLEVRCKCKDCGKLLRNQEVLKLHRLRHHVSVDKVILCTVKGCEHKFELQEDLDHHLKNGHKGKTEMEMCPKCGKYFIAGVRLQHHLKAHERKEKIESGEISFVCEGCGKSFKNQQRLNQHVLQVHTGSESWKFECSVCAKKFPKKVALNVHMRVHTGERPFVCQVCGQAYSHRHNLRIHVNSKHGDVMQDIAIKRDTSNDAPKRKGKGILSQQKK